MRCAVLVGGFLVCGAQAQAQYGVWQADSLLASGRLREAESAYYAATRERPSDPVARAALGRFLAARGAVKVGAVLLEEARRFGGDSARLASALLPMYERAGDYGAVLDLEPDLLSQAERRRARFLRDNPPHARLRDSIAMITYRPSASGDGLGTVILRLGRSELPAMIDPRVSGLVLPATLRGSVRDFGAEGSARLAVARTARLGGIVFTNVPVTISHPDARVRIGFDVLAPYSPTFDPKTGFLTLRRVDRRGAPPVGERLPALYDLTGMRILIGGAWHQGSSSPAAMLLATRTWTWDNRRGDIVLR